jgi:hypothetical protein
VRDVVASGPSGIVELDVRVIHGGLRKVHPDGRWAEKNVGCVCSCSVPVQCISNALSERQLQPQWLHLVVTKVCNVAHRLAEVGFVTRRRPTWTHPDKYPRTTISQCSPHGVRRT